MHQAVEQDRHGGAGGLGLPAMTPAALRVSAMALGAGPSGW